MSQPTREAASLLIDLHSAVAGSGGDIDPQVYASIVARLSAIGAVQAKITGPSEVAIDVTQLLVATTLELTWLIEQLAAASGVPEESVVFDLRKYIENIPG